MSSHGILFGLRLVKGLRVFTPTLIYLFSAPNPFSSRGMARRHLVN